jgi:hypothetical protein
VQAALPSESLKVFDGQLEHEPGSPVVPAGQMFLQSDSASLPTPDIVPPEHGVQLASDDAPTAEDHVFLGQLVHSTAPGEAWNLPASHLSQAVAASDAWCLPASHS